MTKSDGGSERNQPLVSILLPTLGRVHEVGVTLSALLRATTESLQRIEVIVGDNGGAASEFDQALGFAAEVLPPGALRYFAHAENLGLSGNLSFLLGKANGLYAWFVSDDDEIPLGLLDRLVHLLQDVPEGTGLVLLEHYSDHEAVTLNPPALTTVDLERFFSQYWERAVFLSGVVVHCRDARSALALLKDLDLVNHTYPQVLLALGIAAKPEANGCLVAVGVGAVDPYRPKTYSLLTAFRVRIRDQVLLESAAGRLLPRTATAPIRHRVLRRVAFYTYFSIAGAGTRDGAHLAAEYLRLAATAHLAVSTRAALVVGAATWAARDSAVGLARASRRLFGLPIGPAAPEPSAVNANQISYDPEGQSLRPRKELDP